MSGTSLDGIDAALIKTDGVSIQQFGPGITIEYDKDFRKKLFDSLQNPLGSDHSALSEEVTLSHVKAVKQLLEGTKIKPELIGFHGQTIFHRPKSDNLPAQTKQIGNGQMLADLLSLPVIYDFRQNDIANGGEGAPLVPIFHRALVGCSALMQNLARPVVFLNIGGVSNITIITGDKIYAGDAGPGGALIDDWMKARTKHQYDHDGGLARGGIIHHDLLEKWLGDPFFKKPLPKSLDRIAFKSCLEDCAGLSPADGAATLTAFTARAILLTIKSANNQIGEDCQTVILTGGNRRNGYLKQLLSEVNVYNVEDFGWNGDLLEAQAFAFLAKRSLHGLNLSMPTTTGVAKEVSGGKLCHVNRR